MRTLQRKLFRDIARMRAQIIAIVLVVACGVASFVSMISVHASLERSGEEYFAANDFGDLFATVNRAPQTIADRLAEIPGVEHVQTRVVKDVTLDVPGLPEPAVGHLVSLPASGQPVLNKLHLREGRWITPGRDDEVLVSEAFALANDLRPADELTAIIGGRRQQLEIVGIALSPEYIYSMPAGAMWPDDKRFGVLWMSQEALGPAFDMEGAFNDVSMALSRDASFDDVVDAVDYILEPYGCLGAYGRDKQVSARFVKEELEQLETFAAVMPIIFLGVAAFLLNVVMSRMVSSQREQIAALKALGYGNTSIAIHYFELVVLVAVAGTAGGGALGAMLGDAMIGVYHEFFRYPALEYRLETDVLLIAGVLSTAAGVVGTFAAVRRAVRLPPAEAMRPPAPSRFKRGLLERIGLGRLLGPPGRIVMRNLERRPLRTLTSVLGISLSLAMLVSGNFSQDAMTYVMDVNFEQAQRDDVTVRFSHAIQRRAVSELRHMPGVVYAEPARDVAVRFVAGHREYETAIQGLPADGKLRRVLDESLRPVRLPSDGVILTRELGHRLHLSVGDSVRVEILEEDRAIRTVRVAGFIDEMVGLQAYMEIGAVNDLMLEGPRVTGARLLLDPARRDQVYREIKELPHVAGATLRTAAYDIFDETMAQLQLATVTILLFFASVVAVGVIYNGARVVLAERSRELASLRVIGFTRAEISWILIGELGVQLLLAIPLGCWLGYLMAAAVVSGIDAELYRFPLLISPRTYAYASAVVLVVGVVTMLVVRRKLDHLDLVEVLKTRE